MTTTHVTSAPFGSAHPYANNADDTWIYTHPAAADALALTLGASSATEEDYDYLYIADGRGVVWHVLTGTIGAQTFLVPGNVAQITLVTDSSVTAYGFVVASVAVTTWDGPTLTACAKDTFTRAVSDGWGAHEQDGAYTLSRNLDSDPYAPITSNYAVSGGAATITTTTLSLGGDEEIQEARLPDLVFWTGCLQVDWQMPAFPDDCGPIITWRKQPDGAAYVARVANRGGDHVLEIGHLHAEPTGLNWLDATTLPALTPGAWYRLLIDVTQVAPHTTQIQAATWPRSGARPAWQITVLDGLSGFAPVPTLQRPGSVGLGTICFVGGAEASVLPLVIGFDTFAVNCCGGRPFAWIV